MQEECDFQSSLMEKKVSAEARLDTAASSITLSETEIKKSVRIHFHLNPYSHNFILCRIVLKIREMEQIFIIVRGEVNFDRHYRVTTRVCVNDISFLSSRLKFCPLASNRLKIE